jgi:peptide deformylase
MGDGMNEIFTIDTTSGIVHNQKDEEIKPLPLFNDNFPMLSKQIPEYTGKLPNPTLTVLAKRLKMTMKLYAGIGLSANQCGVFERMFVIGHGDYVKVCINPKIVSVLPDKEKSKEGCLSFPGMFLNVDRYKSILAGWYDENGNYIEERLDGLTARCFQHELDHLNGIKMTDHVGPVAIKLARERQRKLIKKAKKKVS